MLAPKIERNQKNTSKNRLYFIQSGDGGHAYFPTAANEGNNQTVKTLG